MKTPRAPTKPNTRKPLGSTTLLLHIDTHTHKTQTQARTGLSKNRQNSPEDRTRRLRHLGRGGDPVVRSGDQGRSNAREKLLCCVCGKGLRSLVQMSIFCLRVSSKNLNACVQGPWYKLAFRMMSKIIKDRQTKNWERILQVYKQCSGTDGHDLGIRN